MTRSRALIESLQKDLFALGARLADPSQRIAARVDKSRDRRPLTVERLEQTIDRLEATVAAAATFHSSWRIAGRRRSCTWRERSAGAPSVASLPSAPDAADPILDRLPEPALGPAVRDGSGRESSSRSAGNRVVTSIVVHYQEIALKGKNRPWFLGRLVRNLRRARCPISTCSRRSRADGTHRDAARARHAAARRPATASGGRSASRTSPTRVAPPLDLDVIAARDPRGPRAIARAPAFASVGAPRRQALSDDLAAGRARDRRTDQGGARMEGRSRTSAELTVHVELLTNEAFYFFGKERGPGGLPTGTAGRVDVPAVGRHRFARGRAPDDEARLRRHASSTSTAIRSCRARRWRRRASSCSC